MGKGKSGQRAVRLVLLRMSAPGRLGQRSAPREAACGYFECPRGSGNLIRDSAGRPQKWGYVRHRDEYVLTAALHVGTDRPVQ